MKVVEGWASPAAVKAVRFIEEAAKRKLYWPGSDPSLATMFTLLAALHDVCLPHSPTILDPASGCPLEVAGGTDASLWDLYSAQQWCLGAKRGNTDRLDALETYLNHVRADLEKDEHQTKRDFRPATEVQAILGYSYKALIKWLADNPEIRRHKPSKNRLLVHVGDALAWKARKDKLDFEAADDQSAAEVADRYAKTVEERKANENKRRARRVV